MFWFTETMTINCIKYKNQIAYKHDHFIFKNQILLIIGLTHRKYSDYDLPLLFLTFPPTQIHTFSLSLIKIPIDIKKVK